MKLLNQGSSLNVTSMMMSHRDAEKYSKGFILKSIQVIVESRLGERISRKCCPSRNDWFNIAIHDDKDVEDRCLKTLNSIKWIGDDSKISSGFTIDVKWKVCCEISMKTSDDHSMVLEYWLFENSPLLNEAENGPNGSPLLNSNPYTFVNVHNKMGILIKSLMSLSRATPAFKLSANRVGDHHSHVICYRVFQCDVRTDQFFKQLDPESNDYQRFCPEIRLGSVQSAHNMLTITFSYRTDLTRCNTMKESSDYACNLPYKEDHFGSRKNTKTGADEEGKSVPCKQLLGAFDSPPPDSSPPFPLLRETSLLNLIDTKDHLNNVLNTVTSSTSTSTTKLTGSGENTVSKPITIPNDGKTGHSPSPGDSSSLDSFVFVENRSLFAPEDENDIGSFFNGPSPSFINSGEVFDEINEISSQLAAIESNAGQWDSFVDSVCSPTSEEDIEEEEKCF